jgi:N-carbamoylputrescine amidase
VSENGERGGREITVALAQLATTETKEEAIAKASDAVAEAASAGADLVVLPDLSFLPFFPQYRTDASWMEWAESIPDGPSTEAMTALAREHGVALVGTIYERVRDGVYYDAGVAISEEGELVGKQRMMHIPEEPNFNEKFYYRPGDSDYPVFDLAGAKVGIALGQDLFYPEHHRLLALHGAEVVVGPNAIAEVTDPLQLCSRAAAVMNHLVVGVANRTGPDGVHTFIGQSHFSGPSGDILVEVNNDDEQVLTHTVDLSALAEIRRTQNYWLRDRRPETYGALVEGSI